MSALAQVLGVALASVGVWLLWSPWALVVGGLLLLSVPEVAAVRRRA